MPKHWSSGQPDVTLVVSDVVGLVLDVHCVSGTGVPSDLRHVTTLVREPMPQVFDHELHASLCHACEQPLKFASWMVSETGIPTSVQTEEGAF